MKVLPMIGFALLAAATGFAVPTEAFRVRDPFVVPSPEDGLYHLFISDQLSGGVGVSVRTSRDLSDWSAPKKVLAIPESWKVVDTWAPEVHRYKGAWYIFVTLGRDLRIDPPVRRMNDDPEFVALRAFERLGAKLRRGVYVFKSASLDGPYEPVSENPLTPLDRLALDGTLWVEDGKPYMVFSWDWPQIMVGECAVVPLKDDLSAFAGEPKTIIRTSDIAPTTIVGIMDGPFVYRSPKSGKLYVLWSTTSIGGDFHHGSTVPVKERKCGAYCVLASESPSGKLAGPWEKPRIVFGDNGGHGMIFRSFEGKDIFTIHQPEDSKNARERTKFFDFIDDGRALSVRALTADSADEPLNWGGRRAHPAVVNPVLPAGDVLSLRGEWEFSLPKRDLPNRNGVWGNFNATQTWGASRKINVPGCWEAQGVGEEGDSETWDPSWDCSPRRIRHKYMGEGWYRRTVRIPESWHGKRIWLKVGGVKSVAWFWVNDEQVAHVCNYCGTEKYDITDLVAPGKPAKIVVDVDNRKPSRKGLMSASHRWGGIYRDIELEATPAEAWIDDCWVRGDFDRHLAEVHVDMGHSRRSDGWTVRATVEGETAELRLDQAGNRDLRTLELPIRNFRPWSPEHPNLYTARVELVTVDGHVVQSRLERFGVRKFEVVGKTFFLNGKPFFVRGFGDDAVYPLTGLSPADRAYHRTHLSKARAAGFNVVRLHTHCENPEYFEAADEVGVLVQAELPYYSDVPCEGFEFDPARDVRELHCNFRRHPSFAVYSMGNEGSFGKVLDRRIHRFVKEMDPDRLKINQDTNREHLSTPDVSDYAGGPITFWPRGSYDPDRPFVCHEFLNLCVKSDSRDAAQYAGVWMPPVTRERRSAWLAAFGLGQDWGDRLQDAQHVLQAVWQKRGIEAARLDPHCDGYSFWTINDVVVWNAAAQTYSAQGLFNPFWADKRRGNTAAGFAQFNSASCVLVDLFPTQCVFTAGDAFKADVFLAHYGEAPMRNARMTWELSAGGRILASGSADIGNQPLGAVRRVSAFNVTVPAVERPAKASLSVSVGDVNNAWDLWLFPRGPSLAAIREKAAGFGVVIASNASREADRARREGRALITVDGAEGKPNVALGWWWMGPQVGTAIRPCRALESFPHEGVLTPLMFRILKQGRELPVPGLSSDDMIIVGEGGEKCYLYLAEGRSGASRSFTCHGIDLLSDLPEANWLLNALVDAVVLRN